MIVFQTIDVQGRGVSMPFFAIGVLGFGEKVLGKKTNTKLLANSSFSNEKNCQTSGV